MTLKAFTAALSDQFKRIGAPEIAPDGRFVVAPVSIPSPLENCLQTDLWLFSTDGSEARQLTFSANCTQPAISPDGRDLAFLSKRNGDVASQIYVLPLQGGEARRVTDLPVNVKEFAWFPDGG